MSKLIRSPLLHFLALGIILFLLYDSIKPNPLEEITISSETINAVIQQQADLQRGPVSEEQRDQLILGLVEDEVLLRVGYNRGVDKNDFRVRNRMLNLVRSSLTEIAANPTYSELKAFFEENKEDYRSDSAWSFEQVYFTFNSKRLPDNNEKFLEELPNLGETTQLGDLSAEGGPRKRISFEQMSMSYGKNFAETITKLPMDQWTGPVNSILGIHFVKVNQVHEPRTPEFDQIESYLRQDYVFEKTRQLQEEKIRELSKQFNIIVEGQPLEL